MIKTLPENVSGRDFVIGDLHGCYGLLEDLLIHVDFDFDQDKDRLISVGDLVDRGPDSMRCLTLLDEPWFHSVKANHEQLMEDYLTGGPTGAWWFRNGGNWWNELDQLGKDEVNRLLPVVQSLPWIITVEGIKKFHVIHAELFARRGYQIFDKYLADLERFKVHAMTEMGDGEACLWGRDLWSPLYDKHIDHHAAKKLRSGYDMNPSYFNVNLSPIYSGHTPVRQPTIIEGQTNLDTAAFRAGRDNWAGLTMTEPATNRFWTAKQDGVREVQPLIIV